MEQYSFIVLILHVWGGGWRIIIDVGIHWGVLDSYSVRATKSHM